MNQLLTKSMFQIREDHLTLLTLIEDAEGELTHEIESALQLTEEQFQDKAISYGYVIKGFDNTESIIEDEIERLMVLKQRAAKRKELFKERLASAMLEFGVEKIESPTLKLSFRKSEAVEITDETVIPQECKELIPETWKISKTKIKEAIKAGEEVPGAELVTRKNLQIK
jgi:hypothetical protein